MKMYDDVDLQKNQLKNVVLENSSEDPSDGREGQIVYNTADKRAKVNIDDIFEALALHKELPTKVSELLNDLKFQTAEEVSETVANADFSKFEIVEDVPSPENAKEKVFYLVYNTKTLHYDIYAKVGDQVLWIDDTTIDLTPYAKRADVDEKLEKKVDKVEGKELSTNDYSNEDKAKLDSVENNADVNKIEVVKVNDSPLQIDEQKAVNIDLSNYITNEALEAKGYATNTELQSATSEINTSLEKKVDKEEGKGLSSNDFTTAEMTKLASIEEGADVNVIEAVKVNGNKLTVSEEDKSVNIDLSEYLTSTELQPTIDAAKEATKEANDAATGANEAAEIANKWATVTATATTLSEGSESTVTLKELDSGKEFVFGIPKGATGSQGPMGPAPKVTVTTAETVNEPGTPSAKVTQENENVTITFDHLKGAKGDQGIPGSAGAKGEQGPQGERGLQGAQGPAGTSIGTITVTSDATHSSTPTCKVTPGEVSGGKQSFTLAFTGLKGATGPAGAKGDTGNTGPAGPTGTAGKGISKTELQSDYTLKFTYTDGTTSTTTSIRGAQGPQGNVGPAGPQGSQGSTGAAGTPGSVWYSGTGITGTNTTAQIFSSSGVSNARVNDYYISTNSSALGYIYKCTVAGTASAAKWAYVGNIRGATGAIGPQGSTGAKGDTGNQGAKGDTGVGIGTITVTTDNSTLTSPTCTVTPGSITSNKQAYTLAFRGLKGATGAQGVQGPAGPTGPQGPAGPTKAATSTAIGAVKPGSNCSVTGDGTLNVTVPTTTSQLTNNSNFVTLTDAQYTELSNMLT